MTTESKESQKFLEWQQQNRVELDCLNAILQEEIDNEIVQELRKQSKEHDNTI